MKRPAKVNILSLQKIFVSILLLLLSVPVYSQKESKEVRKKKNAAVEAQVQKKKDYEEARQKTVKHRFEMQDKKTQKRMKESRKKARKNNKSKKTFFLFRPVKRRKAKKR